MNFVVIFSVAIGTLPPCFPKRPLARPSTVSESNRAIRSKSEHFAGSNLSASRGQTLFLVAAATFPTMASVPRSSSGGLRGVRGFAASDVPRLRHHFGRCLPTASDVGHDLLRHARSLRLGVVAAPSRRLKPLDAVVADDARPASSPPLRGQRPCLAGAVSGVRHPGRRALAGRLTLRHVERNPVRAELVSHAADGRWSSAPRWAGRECLLIPAAGSVERGPRWLTRVNRPRSAGDLSRARCNVTRGASLRSEDWSRATTAVRWDCKRACDQEADRGKQRSMSPYSMGLVPLPAEYQSRGRTRHQAQVRDDLHHGFATCSSIDRGTDGARTQLVGRQRPPGRRVDVVADKLDRAVDHADVHASRVI
jgi:hypothetical protein